jgi:hypothetical protein
MEICLSNVPAEETISSQQLQREANVVRELQLALDAKRKELQVCLLGRLIVIL